MGALTSAVVACGRAACASGRRATLSFPHKLVVAFALTIGIPLLAYAFSVHALNQARLNLIDEAALDQRVRIAEHHLRALGLMALHQATTAAATVTPTGSLERCQAVMEALRDRKSLAGGCVVFPHDEQPPAILGKDLMLDAAIGVSAFARAAAARGPTWGILGMHDSLVVVGAAPVRQAAPPGGKAPVVVLADRLSGERLADLLGKDACDVQVDPAASPGGRLSLTASEDRSTASGELSMRTLSTATTTAGVHSYVAVADPRSGEPPVVLSVTMHRAALPGRGPQFVSIALCALACAALLAAFLTSLVTTWISRPLDDLRGRVEAIAEGQRDLPPMDVATDDALGRVAEAFNNMVASLDDIQRKALQNERLVVAGKMSAAVAHEVRNALSPIQLRADLLLQGVKDPVARDNLLGMRDEVNRSAGLLRSLLEFAGGSAREARPVAVADIINRGAELVMPHFREKRVGLTVDDRSDGATVLAGRAQMLQVVVNLLNNALEADSRHVTLVAEAADGHALILVRDDGTGMDAATLEHALDPFFTTKPAGEGTGLGLSVCHSIVKDYGGSLALDSTEHLGTRVTVSLPLIGGPPCVLAS